MDEVSLRKLMDKKASKFSNQIQPLLKTFILENQEELGACCHISIAAGVGLALSDLVYAMGEEVNGEIELIQQDKVETLFKDIEYIFSEALRYIPKETKNESLN